MLAKATGSGSSMAISRIVSGVVLGQVALLVLIPYWLYIEDSFLFLFDCLGVEELLQALLPF